MRLLVLAVGLAAGVAHAGTTLEGVEVVAKPELAVRLRVSGPVQPMARTLGAESGRPARVYLDLPDATIAAGVPTVVTGSQSLARVRTGRYDLTTVRVVLDLVDPVGFDVSVQARTITIALGQSAATSRAQPETVPVPSRAELERAAAASSPTPSVPSAAPPPVRSQAALSRVEADRAPATARQESERAVHSEAERPQPTTVTPKAEPAQKVVASVAPEPAAIVIDPPLVADEPLTPPTVAVARLEASVPTAPPAEAPAPQEADAPPPAVAVTSSPVTQPTFAPPPSVIAAPSLAFPPPTLPVTQAMVFEPPPLPVYVPPTVAVTSSPVTHPTSSATPRIVSVTQPVTPATLPVTLASLGVEAVMPPSPVVVSSATAAPEPTIAVAPPTEASPPIPAIAPPPPVVATVSPAPAVAVPPPAAVASLPTLVPPPTLLPPVAALKPPPVAVVRKATPTLDARRTLPDVEDTRRPWRVVLDAGHGGHDPGATGLSGVFEKTITLDIARRVAARLAAEIPVEVALTRDDDTFVPIEDRVARAADASLFVSLHANAGDPTLNGVEVFYGGGGRRATAAGPGSPVRLGLDVVEAIERTLGDVRTTVRPGAFGVLTRNTVPSILVEIGYLTNPADAARIADDAYLTQVAQAIADGAAAFLRDPTALAAR